MATKPKPAPANTSAIPYPAPDRRDLIKAMTDHGSNANYAAHFADRMLEKEQALGVIHRDPVTGYTTRVKPADAGDRAEA